MAAKENFMFKCPECDYSHESMDSIRIHCVKIHKINSRDLYVRMFLNGIVPTCACGCGGTPKFYTINIGFVKYVRGHQSRVHNNWGHNKIALDKSHATTKKLYDDGKITAWNDGLTKESDERLKEYGRKISETIRTNPETVKKLADRMREGRLNGTIPTLSGSEHPQWKGGSSTHQMTSRSALHVPWVYPKLKASNFTCQECGSNKNLCVHHDNETFSQILQKALITTIDQKSDEFEYKKIISDWVVAYHIDNNISGVVLCKDCHDLLHYNLHSSDY